MLLLWKKECRSRPPVVEAVTAPVATAAPAAPTRGTSKPDVTCFRCSKKGHKSPDCPTRPKGNRRVQIQEREPVVLNSEELFGAVGECSMSITIDTGAQVSVVPIECVREDQLVGRKQRVRSFQGSLVEGDACIVEFVLGGKTFEREAIAVEGSLINWTPCFQVPLSPRSDLDFLMELAGKKSAAEEEQMYIPPRMYEGTLQTGYMVSGGNAISETQTLSIDVPSVAVVEREDESAEEIIEGLMNIEIDKDEGSSSLCAEAEGDHGTVEEAERVEVASDLDEVAGEPSGGCAVQRSDVLVEGIKGTRTKLVEETENDVTLKVARELGKRESEGYHFKEGILLRTRVDRQGKRIEQLCVPKQLREKCMSLAHTKHGHMGRNKMCALLTPLFYWPGLSKDCQLYVRKCDACQRFDKARPPNAPMQAREIVTLPFERVAVDLVGPFPTAKGGFKFLLTCVDLATRWPEAVPIRVCTSDLHSQWFPQNHCE